MKKILLCALMVIMGCCLLSSCEKDEGAYKQSSFVGTWYEGPYHRWVFTKGGSITKYFNEGASNATTWWRSGTYSYNKSQNTLALTITRDSYENVYYTKLYIVQNISAGQIVLIDSSDGEVVTLRKNK